MAPKNGRKPGKGRALSRPTTCIQPEKDQNSPGGHEADAQCLTRLPHTVQGKREPHHGEPGQGQDVHAEENILSEHTAFAIGRSRLRPASGANLLRLHDRATRVTRLGRRGSGSVGTKKAAERWIEKNPQRLIEI